MASIYREREREDEEAKLRFGNSKKKREEGTKSGTVGVPLKAPCSLCYNYRQ